MEGRPDLGWDRATMRTTSAEGQPPVFDFAFLLPTV